MVSSWCKICCAVLIRCYRLLITVFFSSLASCVPLQAPRDGKIQNNDIKHGALVSFSCSDGFQTNGSGILKCINGKWNGSAPTCKGLRTFPPSFVFIPSSDWFVPFLLLLLLRFFLLATSSSNNLTTYNFKITFIYGFYFYDDHEVLWVKLLGLCTTLIGLQPRMTACVIICFNHSFSPNPASQTALWLLVGILIGWM